MVGRVNFLEVLKIISVFGCPEQTPNKTAKILFRCFLYQDVGLFPLKFHNNSQDFLLLLSKFAPKQFFGRHTSVWKILLLCLNSMIISRHDSKSQNDPIDHIATFAANFSSLWMAQKWLQLIGALTMTIHLLKLFSHFLQTFSLNSPLLLVRENDLNQLQVLLQQDVAHALLITAGTCDTSKFSQ